MLIMGLSRFIDSEFFTTLFPNLEAIPAYIVISIALFVFVIAIYTSLFTLTVLSAVSGLRRRDGHTKLHIIHLLIGFLIFADMVGGFWIVFG